MADSVGPGGRPRQLGSDIPGRINLNDDIIDRGLRVGTLDELHPGRSRGLVRHHYRFHRTSPRWIDAEFANDALAALRSAARGELQGIGGMDVFMDPLSMLRNVGHTPDRVQATAVAWMARMLRSEEPAVAGAPPMLPVRFPRRIAY